MLFLHVIWIIAAVLVGSALLLWVALLAAHGVTKRHDFQNAAWNAVWMERLLDVLDGTAPVETLPVPGSKREMESVIGLLREFGERFRGSYGQRMTVVLEQIHASAFGARLLRSRSADNRLRGCALLARCGPSEEIDEDLRLALRDKDARVVLEAAAALVRRHAVDDIVPVIRSLSRSGAARSLLARDVLKQWGRETTADWSRLFSELWNEDGWVLLLEAAGSAAHGDWTPSIAKLARHPSPTVANTALWALAEMGDPEATSAAMAACGHDKDSVREQATKTLVACGNPVEILPLLEHMLTDPSFEVRRVAMDGYLKLGGRARLQTLVPVDRWQEELFKEAGLMVPNRI